MRFKKAVSDTVNGAQGAEGALIGQSPCAFLVMFSAVSSAWLGFTLAIY